MPIVRPVTVPSEARPASGPRSGLAVPPAPSMVTRSSLKVGIFVGDLRLFSAILGDLGGSWAILDNLGPSWVYKVIK